MACKTSFTMDDRESPVTLRYDFDICPGAEGAPLALFRDRRTVEALRGADPDVRAYFVASGFGLHVFDSGYAPGTYPARDMADRMVIVERLSANLGVFDLGGLDMNGFDFESFMAHLGAARPAGEPAAKRPRTTRHPRATERTAAVLGVMFLTMVYGLIRGGGALAGF